MSMTEAVIGDPFISICIPTYKNVDYLQRLLESVIIQTYKDFEVIITDNSPDNSTEQLANHYSKKLSIRYHRNNPPTGMAENFNIVIQKAKGEWIKIMHDDDWFSSPMSLQKFADVALTTSKNFIFSAYNDIHAPSGKQVNEYLTASKKKLLEGSPLNLFSLNAIGHPSTVMHFYKWVCK